jgi:hypothetical protein
MIISLIVDDNINPIFLKANSALLKKYQITNTEQLTKLWKSDYAAELVLPEYILFDNQIAMTTFMLKFS